MVLKPEKNQGPRSQTTGLHQQLLKNDLPHQMAGQNFQSRAVVTHRSTTNHRLTESQGSGGE